MDGPVVFYAWQSDRDSKTNHYFIRDAVAKAIRDLGREDEVTEAPRLDHDTRNVPGSPDIASTIFTKIEGCAVFIADLTFVATAAARSQADPPKQIPNPNVLIELGYALACVGYERVITVMNTAFGPPEDLPFDLRGRRHPVLYHLREPDAEDRKEVQAALAAELKLRIRGVLEHSPKAAPAPEQQITDCGWNLLRLMLRSDNRTCRRWHATASEPEYIGVAGVQLRVTETPPEQDNFRVESLEALDWLMGNGYIATKDGNSYELTGPGAHLAPRWRDHWPSLNIENLELPGRAGGRYFEDYTVLIHHTGGPPFRVAEARLFINVPGDRKISAEGRATLKARGYDAHDFPPFFTLTLTHFPGEGDARQQDRREVAKGDSFQASAVIGHVYPWEFIPPEDRRFAVLRVYSQGRIIEEFNVSGHLRNSVLHYAQWRQEKRLALWTIRPQEVPDVTRRTR